MKKLGLILAILILGVALTITIITTILKPIFLIPVPISGDLNITCTAKQNKSSASNQVRIHNLTVNGQLIDNSNFTVTSIWKEEDGLLVCYNATKPEKATITLDNIQTLQVELVGQSGSGIVDISFLDKKDQIDLYSKEWKPIKWEYTAEKTFSPLKRFDLVIELYLGSVMFLFIVRYVLLKYVFKR